MFGSIAANYDRTNAILSFQMHRYWNRQLVKSISEKHPTTLLDLCCGTGEIAFRFLNNTSRNCKAYLLDFCPEMLACAKTREQGFEHHDIDYIEGDAQAIPLPDESVDAITIAYGIRNVKEPRRCFADAHRVLRHGGRIAILELTRPKNRFLRLGHGLYLKIMLPLLGKLSTSNQEAYEYLCNSIDTFIDPADLEMELRDCGFPRVRRIPLQGGIATIILADKA